MSRADPVAVAEGRLQHEPDGLYELDPELVDEPQVLIEDIVSLNGFDFGPDGMLYGPLRFGGGRLGGRGGRRAC
jgi:hypothetical protein